MAIYAQLDLDILLTFPITQQERDTTYANADFIVKCIDLDKPVINTISQKYNMTPIIVGDQVLVKYEVTNKTVEELLNEIVLSGNTTVSTISPDLLNATTDAIKERVQNLLDDFARTRGYDDIKSAASYKTSSNTQFQTEGARAEYLRDTTWTNLITYLTNLSAGSVAFPTTWTDISSKLPALTWV